MKLLSVLSLVLILGCAGEKENQPGDNSPAMFKLSDTWTVTSKSCDGVNKAASENYKFDSDYLIRVTTISDNDSQLCKQGNVYNRVVSSAKKLNKSVVEAGSLRSAGAKKSCWQKQNGQIIKNSVRDQVVPANSELLAYKLQAMANTVLLEIVGSTECPGSLVLNLEKSR